MPSDRSMTEIAQIVSDASCFEGGKNSVGAAWAYRHISTGQCVIKEESGRVAARELGVNAIFSDIAEIYAALVALESAPAEWHGQLLVDNEAAFRLFHTRVAWEGLPYRLASRFQCVVAKLGKYSVHQVVSHPSATSRKLGYQVGSCGKRRPVSSHHVACDKLCRKVARLWKEEESVLFHAPPALPKTINLSTPFF